MKNLTFNRTLTVEQFKKDQLVDRLLVKKNPKTDKLFFSFGSSTGAVASKGVPKSPMVSEVATPDGETFWLLHEEGQGAPTLATF